MIARWAFESLRIAPARTAGSVGVIAAAFTLVLAFKGVWEGETEQLAAYLENAGADVWVMQEDVTNMHMATSFLSDGKRALVSRVDGVEAVSPILYVNTLVEAGGRQWFCYIVGLERAGQDGGPWAMARGEGRVSPGEAIIPATLARVAGIGVGDEIRLADHALVVTGLSEGTFSVTNPITFVHRTDLEEILSIHGYDSYLLVRARDDVTARDLAGRIRAEVDKVTALPTATFVANDLILAKQMGVEVIAILTAICAGLAVFLVLASLYVQVSRVRRELAVLKAVGFRTWHLQFAVLLQSMFLTITAFGLAIVFSHGIAVVTAAMAPLVRVHVTLDSVMQVGLVGLVVAIVPPVLLTRNVARVDPATVFQG